MTPTKRDDETARIDGDMRDLREDVKTLTGNIQNMDGRLKGTLPHLATKQDLEKSISQHLNSHVKSFHGRKTPSSIIPVPAAPMDKKVILGLVGVIVVLGSGSSKLLDVVLAFFQ